MCVLCDQALFQQFERGESKGWQSSYRHLIAPAELVDSESVRFTRHVTDTDQVLDYYLHTPGGAITTSGGGFGGQEIQSLVIPGSDQDFFRSIVAHLDNIIDLDFRQVYNSSDADVDLFYDSEIDLGDGGITLGLATNRGFVGWELSLNYPALENNDPYRHYVLIHELGHSLGLEHPFDDSDGDVFKDITDPSSSAYPEETVMAYRSPRNGSWPDFFTDSDLNALIEIWGAEARNLTSADDKVIGNSYRDLLFGGNGSDYLRGLAKNDLLQGGQGDDSLFGGPGADQLFGGAGNDTIHGGFGHDEIRTGSGNDNLRGGPGADLFILGSGQNIIEDFSVVDHDRIGIVGNIDFQYFQYSDRVEIISAQGSTVLKNYSLGKYDPGPIIVQI